MNQDADVITARQRGRDLARDLGVSATDLTMIVTATSELARNIVRHAGHGEGHASVYARSMSFAGTFG